MNDHKAETLYESDGKTPNGDPFMSVKQARGFYQYAERGGIDSITFILYDKTKKSCYGLIHESKPPIDERENKKVKLTTAFGGSIDMGENVTYAQICQTEVAEEAGFEVSLERIHEIGKTLVSTQMSQYAYGFLVDVDGINMTLVPEHAQSNARGDIIGNKVVWMNELALMDNNDWKSVWILSQAKHKNICSK